MEIRTCKVLGKCRIEKRIEYKHVAGGAYYFGLGRSYKNSK